MDRSVYDKYVFMIAEQGSLTKAAAALGISQPALSSGLTVLEKSLGYKLFNRRTVPVSFTPEGEVYYSYIQRVRVLNADLEKRIGALSDESENRAVIGGPAVYVESMLAEAVIQLGKRNPEYRFSLKTASLPELIRAASTGEIHCFVSTSAALPEHFTRIPVRHESLYLVIPEDDPAFAGGEPDYSLLNGKKMIFLEENQPLQKSINEFFDRFSIRMESAVTVNQVSTALSLALRGGGICIASGESLNEKVNLQGVRIWPLPDETFGRTIYIAYDSELHMPRACRSLIGLLSPADGEDPQE